MAAYCRVSTDDIDQAISIHLQQTEYKKKIKSNPDWIFAGMYVDNGFSGTNTAHRPGFLKLIEDCRAGKIDMVITKAVSRFARNLMDCIKYVEELKSLNPPVNVYFEQEKLDTGLQTSGVILIVLAMVAEEESHMKSEAMLLSLEWRFSRGRFLTPALFGYDKVEVPDGFGSKKKTLVVDPQQAKVVEWIVEGVDFLTVVMERVNRSPEQRDIRLCLRDLQHLRYKGIQLFGLRCLHAHCYKVPRKLVTLIVQLGQIICDTHAVTSTILESASSTPESAASTASRRV